MGRSANTRATAETYLDEMLAAEESLDYEGWIARFERRFLVHFGESRFRKDLHAIRHDLGAYVTREYLGSLSGFREPEEEEKYPGCVRYVWKGVFEKNETLIVVGLHERDGTVHVNQFLYNH